MKAKLGGRVVSLDGDETILVIDDELIVRRMVMEILKSSGYTVIGASTGQEGLEWYQDLEGRVDLVLLDMIMPGMDGAQTFDALRKQDPQPPVLITSGFVESNRCKQILENGGRGIVHKPYKSDDLRLFIRKALAADG